jgi:hypothetical protein
MNRTSILDSIELGGLHELIRDCWSLYIGRSSRDNRIKGFQREDAKPQSSQREQGIYEEASKDQEKDRTSLIELLVTTSWPPSLLGSLEIILFGLSPNPFPGPLPSWVPWK